MAGLGVFVPQNGNTPCLIRSIAQDSIWEADSNGELCAWSSASHPLVPTQLEIDNAETSITTNPELCNVAETLVENTQGDSLVGIDSNGDLLLEGQTIANIGQDNLGDHTATQDLDLAGFDIVNLTELSGVGANTVLLNGGLNFTTGSQLLINSNGGTVGQALLTDGNGVPFWDSYSFLDLDDLPTSFPPDAHTHVLADITDLDDTGDLPEGTNLYYTEARVSANPDVAANTAARHDALTLDPSSQPGISLDIFNQVLNYQISGPAFPPSPVDGQVFYNTSIEFGTQYIYSTTIGRWLGPPLGPVIFNESGQLANDEYMRLGLTRTSPTTGFEPNREILITRMRFRSGTNITGNIDLMDRGVVLFSLSFVNESDQENNNLQILTDPAAIIAVQDAGGTIGNPSNSHCYIFYRNTELP